MVQRYEENNEVPNLFEHLTGASASLVIVLYCLLRLLLVKDIIGTG